LGELSEWSVATISVDNLQTVRFVRYNYPSIRERLSILGTL
jgi:hypothetical protein